MEPTERLLDQILSHEALDNLIQTSTCLETLKYLLHTKHQRIIKGQCEKLDFSIDLIYNDSVNVDLANQILKTTLFVAVDCNTQVSQATKYCIEKLRHSHDNHQLFFALSLFSVILEHFKNEQTLFHFSEYHFIDCILTILKGSSKPLITFTLIQIIPNYLSVTDKETSNTLLIKLFTFIKESKKLEFLCICFDKFIKPDLINSDLNLLTCDDLWFLLKKCLEDQHHYMRRQAVYLLSKAVNLALQPHNIPYLPLYLKSENMNEVEKIWRNYLILLDVSSEKQLHIVDPSLCLFTSVKNLNFLWRDCLYNIFLHHSQNSVVYNVAIFILHNETEWHHFSKILKVMLCAINRNEYSSDSNRVFQEIGSFCNRLENPQLEILLHETVNVSWVPAAAWGFYSHIFKQTLCLEIPLSLLESLIKNLKLMPHVFIRNACMKIIVTYFMKNNYYVDSLENLLKFLCFLRTCHDVFEETVLENFIRNNEDKILFFKEELCNQVIHSLVSGDECDNLENYEISLKILQLLKIEISPRITTLSVKTDLIYLLLDQLFSQVELENYVMNRIDSLQNSENISPLLLLSRKKYSVKLSEKALSILIDEDTNKYNKTQKIIALGILSQEDVERNKSVINVWRNYFLNTSNFIDETITKFFVQIFLKHLTKSSTIAEVEQSVTVLENILDSQSEATITILENLSPVFKFARHKKIHQFIERCFDEFLILIKSNCGSKYNTSNFLSKIFDADLLECNEFCETVLNFCQKLLDVANSFNSVAYILSEKLGHIIQQNPSKRFIFVPIIVKLTLDGIIVNKNERVNYCVCQEIGSAVPSENNPNFEGISTRLWALESMLILVNKQHSENVNTIVSSLVKRYLVYFSKRYFPDSQIHLEKLRILQCLILLHKHITSEKSKLIELIMQSFLQETHQPSVKHLMQWLLIMLTKNESHAFIQSVCEKLKTIDNNRPSTVSGLIPVLYHLTAAQDETQWDQIVEILLPYTMGAQFKLRIFSQVALLKLYEKAVKMNHSLFLQKYKFLYDSLKQVIEATGNAPYDVSDIHHEFLDYFSLDNCDCSTVFYTIPKNNGVTNMEWTNLSKVSAFHQFKYIKFNHSEQLTKSCVLQRNTSPRTHPENFQKKITPWKDILDNCDAADDANNFILVSSLIEKSANLGGLSRTCEVFGIKKMVMRTSKITTDKEFKSLSMSSESWVDITEVKVEDLQEFILGVKKQGYSVIGAEQTAESTKLDKFQFPKLTVLVLGNEKEGIPPDLIPLMDTCIEIPQFGMVRSLNVHVAGAIVIWEYCKQQKL